MSLLVRVPLLLVALSCCGVRERPAHRADAHGPATSDAAVATAPADSGGHDLLRFLPALTLPPADPARLLAQLERERTHARPAERIWIDHAVGLVRAMQRLSANPSPEQHQLVASFEGLVALIRELGQARPDDPEVQFQVASAFGALATTAMNLEIDPEPLRREGLAVTESLIQRVPTDARPWSLLATDLFHHGDEAEHLRAARRCVELDPGSAFCRETHAALAEYWERPRCAGRDVAPDLRLDIEAVTVLTSVDVTEVRASHEGVTLMLAPSAARRFEVRSQERSMDRRATLRRGREVLHEASLPSFYHLENLQLTPVELARLCLRVERRTLPADLRLADPVGR